MFLRVDTTTASAAATEIFEGAGLTQLAGGYNQLLGTDHTAGDIGLAGVAAGHCSWTTAETGVFVPVWTTGYFWFYHSGAAVTDIGNLFEADEATDPVSVSDWGTQYAVLVGRCVDFKTNYVLLNITGYALGAATQIGA